MCLVGVKKRDDRKERERKGGGRRKMEGQWRLSPIWFKRKGKARKMVSWGIFHPNPPFFPSKLGVKGDGN